MESAGPGDKDRENLAAMRLGWHVEDLRTSISLAEDSLGHWTRCRTRQGIEESHRLILEASSFDSVRAGIRTVKESAARLAKALGFSFASEVNDGQG